MTPAPLRVFRPAADPTDRDALEAELAEARRQLAESVPRRAYEAALEALRDSRAHLDALRREVVLP